MSHLSKDKSPLNVLILASSSTVRAQILQSCGVSFRIVPSNVDEEQEHNRMRCGNSDLAKTGKQSQSDDGISMTKQRCIAGATRLASAKALSVARNHPGSIVLGADQTGWCRNRILTKARSRAEVMATLRALEGKWHHLYSHICLARDNEVIWHFGDQASLRLRKMSETFLQQYLDQETEEIQKCLGGYRFEGVGQQLFDTCRGDYYTILGLPTLPLLMVLRSFGLLAS